MEGTVAAAVRAVVEPAVRDLGLELLLVEVTGGGGRTILRLYVDREGEGGEGGEGEGEGVTLDNCAAVSREVSPVLDVEDPIGGPFVLEVSSPGLNRPLVRPEHFERHAGSRVRLRTGRPVDGRHSFIGTLVGLDGGDVVVDENDGQRYRVPYEALSRANVEHQFDA